MRLSKFFVAAIIGSIVGFAIYGGIEGARALSRHAQATPHKKEVCVTVDEDASGGPFGYCVVGNFVCIHQDHWGQCVPQGQPQAKPSPTPVGK